MAESGKKSARAGGFILAVAILGGVIAGILLGQPSAGLLVGTAFGILVALALWWHDRRAGG